MRSTELAMQLSEMTLKLDEIVRTYISQLESQFTPTTDSNKDNEIDFQIHRAMCALAVFSHLGPNFATNFKLAKEVMDESLRQASIDPDGKPGQTVTLATNGAFHFSKKRNNNGVALAAKDLMTELRLLGVEKEVIEKAKKSAEKVRAGNTYYQIGAAK